MAAIPDAVTPLRWRRKPEPIRSLETAEEYADLAEKSFGASDSEFAAELASVIPRAFHGVVVDLGSGPGNVAIPLANLRPDLHIICYDYNAQMLEIARRRAPREHLSEQRLCFQQGDMRQLAIQQDGMTRAFVYSNTALHELRTRRDLQETFVGIARAVGEHGGCFIRDLALPEDAQQAACWRREVLGEAALPRRELELFVNSQHAAFRLEVVQDAINRTSLRGRGSLVRLQPPRSRYWLYHVPPL
jgi:ubiquinone/menaquinone biosynthesis C-methylase UbiE